MTFRHMQTEGTNVSALHYLKQLLVNDNLILPILLAMKIGFACKITDAKDEATLKTRWAWLHIITFILLYCIK